MFPTRCGRLWAGLLPLVLATAIALVPATASAGSPSPFGASFARRFAAPPGDAEPKIRY